MGYFTNDNFADNSIRAAILTGLPALVGASAVRFDAVQALSTAQKTQARENIDAVSKSGDTILGSLHVGAGTNYFKFQAESTSAGVAKFGTTATGNTGNVSFANASNWNFGVVGVVSGTGAAAGDVYGLGYSPNANSSFTPVLKWTSSGDVIAANRFGVGGSPSYVGHFTESAATAAGLVKYEVTGTHAGNATYSFQAASSVGVAQFGIDRYFNTSGAAFISTTAAGGLIFSADNNTRHLNVLTNGNIGFGVVPVHKADIAGDVNAAGVFLVDGVQVVGNRAAAVTAPTGGLTIDTEARTAITALILRLQTHGLIS